MADRSKIEQLVKVVESLSDEEIEQLAKVVRKERKRRGLKPSRNEAGQAR